MNSKIGNYNKQQLKDQLKSMGLKGDETILIHSSMKSIGEVDGGADTVLDAWMEYFKDGLLLLPTHTWKTVNADNPVYNPQITPSCVGLLTNMFMKRDGVIRSLHPTHSMAGYGKMLQNIWQVRNIIIHHVLLVAVMTGLGMQAVKCCL